MPADPLRRAALVRSIAARLDALGLDELRLIDHVTTRLQLGRERYGELDLAAPRDWSRELGEELVDALVYQAARELAAQDLARESLREAARAEMVGGGTVGGRDLQPWIRVDPIPGTPRVVTASSGPGGPYLLTPISQPIAAATAMTIGLPGDDLSDPIEANQFAVDQHATRIGGPEPYESIDVQLDDLQGEGG